MTNDSKVDNYKVRLQGRRMDFEELNKETSLRISLLRVYTTRLYFLRNALYKDKFDRLISRKPNFSNCFKLLLCCFQNCCYLLLHRNR